jgi:hypothetical protein
LLMLNSLVRSEMSIIIGDRLLASEHERWI